MREFVGVLGREYNSLHIYDLHSIPKNVLAPIGIVIEVKINIIIGLLKLIEQGKWVKN